MGKVIITGVAGFIGAHAAWRFGERGWRVVGLDNLSRRGSTVNLEWLRGLDIPFTFDHADLRCSSDVDRVLSQHPDTSALLHLGGQVAVTMSVVDPRSDFEANALGTLNVLEAVRRYCPHAVVLFASTNKVYGGMEDVPIVEDDGRYRYKELSHGVGEDRPLDFHSPYGCSKGAADQYVRDYARIYGLRTVVLRQSCIYGTRQFGVEDQGWVAWFTIAASLGRPITIYGDGKQVRDVLWIDDLLDLYLRLVSSPEHVGGEVYNVGGGPENTLSLNELVGMLGVRLGKPVRVQHADWRPGDQKVFVADIRKVRSELGWEPRTSPETGVQHLLDWVLENRAVLEHFAR